MFVGIENLSLIAHLNLSLELLSWLYLTEGVVEIIAGLGVGLSLALKKTT